jgi:hypothetical protein
VVETIVPITETVNQIVLPIVESTTPALETIEITVLPVVATPPSPVAPVSSHVAPTSESTSGTTPSRLAPVATDQALAADTSTPLQPAAPAGEASLPALAPMPQSGAAFELGRIVRTAPATHDRHSGSSAAGTSQSAHGSALAADFFSTDLVTAPATVSAVGSSPHSSMSTTEAPSSPSLPGSGSPGTGLSGSFAPPTTAPFLGVLRAFCFGPCLRNDKVVLTPARWRPVLFVSLLERPG